MSSVPEKITGTMEDPLSPPAVCTTMYRFKTQKGSCFRKKAGTFCADKGSRTSDGSRPGTEEKHPKGTKRCGARERAGRPARYAVSAGSVSTTEAENTRSFQSKRASPP